jgi:hypothetical protein
MHVQPSPFMLRSQRSQQAVADCPADYPVPAMLPLLQLWVCFNRLTEADEVYTQAAAAAYGSDFSSYGKAVAAMGRIQQETAAQALQVCLLVVRVWMQISCL